jgi:hypothetical protein
MSIAPQVKHVPIIAKATTIVVAMRRALKVSQSICCSKPLEAQRRTGCAKRLPAVGSSKGQKK